MQTLGSWKHAPLAYVAAELRLASVLSIDPLATSLQEALGEHFPRLARGQQYGFVFAPTGMTQQSAPRFHFLSADAAACVVLTPDVLALHVTRYTNAQDFSAQFVQVLEALVKARAYQFVERAGLRYWDIVQAEGGLTVADFFAAPLAGLLAPINGASLARDVHELHYYVDGPTVQLATARVSLTAPAAQPQPNNFMVVPELEPSPRLRAAQAMAASDSAATVGYLDIDVSTDIKATLDVQNLTEVMRGLHRTQSALFKGLTSPRGQAYWENGDQK